MKFNILKLFDKINKKYFKNDLFSKTRYRLTIFYSGLLMLFLILFMVISYSVFYAIISKEQKQETIELASQVTSSNQIQFQNIINQNIKGSKRIIISSTNHEAFFCYVFDKNRKYMGGIDRNILIHKEILNKLDGWSPKPNRIKNINISYSRDQSIYLGVTWLPIYEKGQYIGRIFLGRDLTFYFNTLERLLFILIGLFAIFLIIATFIGYYMAKQAIIPIVEAYEKQQVFVADASHELRTPLSVIQSSIEVIEMEEKNKISEFSYNILLDMKDEVHSMKKLTTDLLSLSRYDSQKYSINYEMFDFNTIANQILRTTKTMGESRDIKIILETTDPLIVRGDKDKLKQLLYILIDNAIKYSPSGGEIIISLSYRVINNTRQLCIKVKDSGIGISLEQYDRIFDRFYRGDKNRTRETGGTGLGLAIAKSIVEAHNGSIEVQSTPGKGTEFTIYIPYENSY